jgi:hypothetical protein
MKTIAYSEVPQTHSYVHLAYTSASTGPAEAALPAAFLGTITYLLIYLLASASRLKDKYAKAWRLVTVAFATAVAFLVVVGLGLGVTLAGH